MDRVTPQPSVRRAMTTGWRIMGEPLAIQPVPMDPTNIISAPRNPCQTAMYARRFNGGVGAGAADFGSTVPASVFFDGPGKVSEVLRCEPPTVMSCVVPYLCHGAGRTSYGPVYNHAILAVGIRRTPD
ncbi:MAG: hypothetical protein NVS2B15_01030 [Pseudarthrobacter sp.]